tara:strand:+ start:68 stop:196 length:129 start_codon:yes stop_codon:yes gene_type:complete
MGSSSKQAPTPRPRPLLVAQLELLQLAAARREQPPGRKKEGH